MRKHEDVQPTTTPESEPVAKRPFGVKTGVKCGQYGVLGGDASWDTWRLGFHWEG